MEKFRISFRFFKSSYDMNFSEKITQKSLKEILEYNEKTGEFIYRVNRGKFKIGDVAGTNRVDGYTTIKIHGTPYLAHRLAWLYVTGFWPTKQIDHINRNKRDNKFCNLREATNLENGQNVSISAKNTSGHTGVSWYKRKQKWQAQIKLNHKCIHLGYFCDKEDAILARAKAKAEIHRFNPTNSNSESLGTNTSVNFR